MIEAQEIVIYAWLGMVTGAAVASYVYRETDSAFAAGLAGAVSVLVWPLALLVAMLGGVAVHDARRRRGGR